MVFTIAKILLRPPDRPHKSQLTRPSAISIWLQSPKLISGLTPFMSMKYASEVSELPEAANTNRPDLTPQHRVIPF